MNNKTIKGLLALTLAFAINNSTLALGGDPFKCTWTVKGIVQVDHQLAELNATFGDISPLEDLDVKVSAKTKTLGVWGTWNKWAEVTTNRDGAFEVNKEKTCDDSRRFKVEVRFKDSEIEVRHETATSSPTKVKWFTIHEDTNGGRSAHILDLGARTFSSSGAQDLNDGQARDHADVWVTARTVIDKFDNYGSGFAFEKPVVIKVRHNSWVAPDNVEASYTNPFTSNIYLYRSNDGTRDDLRDQGISVVLHEMAHVWAFQHSSGEEDLPLNLFMSGSTHCFEPEHVAFAEGFAEFAAEQLGRLLFGLEAPLPFNRNALNTGLSCEGRSDRITSLQKMSEHEYGHMSAFRLLMQKDLNGHTFEGAPQTTDRNHASTQIDLVGGHVQGCPASPTGFVFKKVLSVFLSDQAKGYPNELRKSEMTVEGFVSRAADLLEMDAGEDEFLLDLLDPASAAQPRDRCGGMVVDRNQTQTTPPGGILQQQQKKTSAKKRKKN